MGGVSDIEQFQRWLQAQLAMSENIEDPSERERVEIQIESAIQLIIQYRQIIDEQYESIPSPFSEMPSPVRVIEDGFEGINILSPLITVVFFNVSIFENSPTTLPMG